VQRVVTSPGLAKPESSIAWVAYSVCRFISDCRPSPWDGLYPSLEFSVQTSTTAPPIAAKAESTLLAVRLEGLPWCSPGSSGGAALASSNLAERAHRSQTGHRCRNFSSAVGEESRGMLYHGKPEIIVTVPLADQRKMRSQRPLIK